MASVEITFDAKTYVQAAKMQQQFVNQMKPLGYVVSNGDFISDGSIDVGDITVQNGDCIVHHKIDSCTINVNNGTLDCYDVNSNKCEIHATDYVCRYYEE